ncbi:MAG: GFA family protein [Alphaproteobacteria bacterium]|nr:GFA family protein [Alphaproteobacteria bacterium]MBV9692062.1 GFA family protein [Alphaproteobacteria bacterium]
MGATPSRKKTPDGPEAAARRAKGTCLCGAVAIEIAIPAFWAWHDHSANSRKAHGAAYATYVGCWKKNVRVAKGKSAIATFADDKTGAARSFCARCGTPLFYERRTSAHMINIPRALFAGRTGREPRYHLNAAEMADWIYSGAPLVPLKGFPGVVWQRPTTRKPRKG